MEDRLIAAAILALAASPLALWASKAQSGEWIDVIVPETEALSPPQRRSLAPLISAGLWLQCALLLTIPVALLILSSDAFGPWLAGVSIVMTVSAASGSLLLRQRIRSLIAPP